MGNKYLEKIAMSPTLKRVAAEAYKDYSKLPAAHNSQIIQRMKEGRNLAHFTQSNLKKPVSVLGNREFVTNMAKFHPQMNKGIYSIGESAKTVTDSFESAKKHGILVGDQMKAQSVAARLARMRSKLS